MILSSGYLFAEGISGGASPMPEEVYFENGRFNPIHIPNGFDFANKCLYIDQDEEDLPDLYNDFLSGRWSEHFDDGTRFMIRSWDISYITHDDMVIEGNFLKFVGSVSWGGSQWIYAVLPVVGMNNKYTSLKLRYRITPGYYEYIPTLACYKRDGNTLEEGYEATASGYDEWRVVTTNTMDTDGCIDFILIMFAYMNIQEPLTIEIDKIWAE